MGYLAAWNVLERMIVDLRKTGLSIPAEVMKDLKSAKTMIKILKADMSRGETIQKIERYLENVESYVVFEGQKKFGGEYVEKWLKRLGQASSQIFCEEEDNLRFISGIPREKKWIRIKPSTELPIKNLKALAKEFNLSYNIQNDGFLLIFGREKSVKDLVKKISAKYKEK